jgi:uncharacterized repeat protein (TIGR01451 family)
MHDRCHHCVRGPVPARARHAAPAPRRWSPHVPLAALLAAALAASAVPAARAQVGVPVGALEDGGAITIEFDVTIDSPVTAGATEVCNQGTVAGDNFDPDVSTDDPTAGGGADPTCTGLDAQPDLTIAKSDGGATATPGGTVAYTLTFANAGNQGATGVAISDTVPANTTFNPGASTAGWVCVPDDNPGSLCTFAVGAVAGGGAGGAVTFAVTVVSPVPAGVDEISNTATIADDGANGADPTPANNSSTDTTPVDAAPDLTIAKDDGGATATPGATIAYTLTYANDGDQDATGVVLSDTVPANTTFNAGASTAGWVCVPSTTPGSVCTLAVGGLAGGGAGGVATFAVDVIVAVPAGVEEISNTATIADDGTNGADPNPGDNSATDTTPLDAEPDLSIDKRDDDVTTVPGGTLVYFLDYANLGNQGATGVVISETVPPNTTFNAGASDGVWSCADGSPAGTPCTRTIGAVLAQDGSGTSFAVTVVDPLPAGVDLISNTAMIADDGTNGVDPTPGDNADTETTPVIAQPDMTVAKEYTGSTPFPGDTIAFDIDYANAGNQDAVGVVLHEEVPPDTTFNAGASTAGWSCADGSPAGTSCDLTIGAVAGGGAAGSAVFAVDLDDPLPPGTSETENCVSIADDGANGADPNPGDNEDCFTVGLDSIPPTVDNLDTTVSTPGGTLDDCETANVEISEFHLTFSEPMFDPPGDIDAGDVTNPASYQLVEPGPDLEFDTATCGGAAGDDIAVPLPPGSVTYDSGTDTATIDLGAALADSLYRLFACGTLRDLAGNPLDGDGNDPPGDDFVRQFRADPDNLFANGHFDCDLGDWVTAVTAGATIAHDDDDADASPESGSALGSVPFASGMAERAALGQCVGAPAGGELELAARFRITTAPASQVTVSLVCEFYSAGSCAGGPLGTLSTAQTVTGPTGAWQSLTLGAAAPSSSVSALCSLMLDAAAGVTFDGHLDRAILTGPGLIFEDGFESGDTSAWSATTPLTPLGRESGDVSVGSSSVGVAP